jgi:uncharacterized membrane protein
MMLLSPQVLTPHVLPQGTLTEVAASRADWTDAAALAIFMLVWLGYSGLISLFGRRLGAINTDMVAIRERWMRAMMRRPERRLLDSQLMGHSLTTTSFFASTNLILIAAVAGALFGGERTYRAIADVPLLAHSPRMLFEFKLILVLATLAGGLLDFVWSIRQLNYCLALVGAAPWDEPDMALDEYADATSLIFNRALGGFNSGVRGYYFALAAAAWLISSGALVLASLGAVALLLTRQMASPTARGIRQARAVLDSTPPDPPLAHAVTDDSAP